MRFIGVALWFSILTHSSHAQTNLPSTYSPVSLGVTFGTFGAGLNLELAVNEKQGRFYHTDFIRVLGGLGSIDMGIYYYLGGAWEIIYGPHNHHFEMGYGASVIYDRRAGEIFPLPVAFWGYRYHKPNTRFYFRTGLGCPDVLYVGLGFGLGKN